MSVLHPFSANEHTAVMAEADLAGPLVFCLLFGATMLASGRIQFGHIYGTAMLSCVFLYTVLNLMSDRDVTFSQVASVLGCVLSRLTHAPLLLHLLLISVVVNER
jgi:hypothetical protein